MQGGLEGERAGEQGGVGVELLYGFCMDELKSGDFAINSLAMW